MNIRFSTVLGFGGVLTAMLVGCSQKQDQNQQLDRAVKALEQPAAAPAGQPAEAAAQSAPAQQLKDAISSYKENKLDDAVVRLQRLRAASVTSPQQIMVVNDAISAVMNDVYQRAAQGDPKAIQAVNLYKQIQTQPH